IMSAMSGVLLLLLVAVVLGVDATTPDEEGLPSASRAGVNIVRKPGMASLASDVRQGRVFAYYSTTSYTKLSTTTVSRLSTCLSVTSSGACTGRKKRSVFRIVGLDDTETDEEGMELLGSKRDDEIESTVRVQDGIEEDKKDERKRRNITIWSTAFSTLTLTSTSYISGTTVTASALCTGLSTAGCFGR
ncbi:unnamed protein product, partial [Meganyctiphanes norvegica]